MIGIQVVALAGKRPDSPSLAWFGADGGDIGRGQDCTLVLPDPERRISRKHASIIHRNGRYFVRVASANLPMELDGRALMIDQEAELSAGMTIRLGAFQLQVLDQPDSLGVAAPASPSSPRRTAFAELLDELGPPAGAAARAERPAEPAAAREVDLLVGDPSQWRNAAPPPSQPQPIPVPAAVATPGKAAAAEEAAAALLAGLGLSPQIHSRLTTAQFQLVGALLRTMTGGTLELLTARMVAKRELGANATQLRTRENNPLKFSPDVDSALTHLLGPSERGFLPPLEAAQEAFDDLRAHQVALLAGMRAALDSVMARFDPAALEQRLTPGGAWESLIPSQRKARLWTEYSQQFAQIVNEVEGDFDALLGRAFLKAYEAQLAELARGGRAGDPS